MRVHEGIAFQLRNMESQWTEQRKHRYWIGSTKWGFAKKNAIQDFDISQEETFFHCCKQNLVLVRLAICYAHATPTSYDLHWNGFFLHKTPLCGTLLWWMDALFWTSKSQHPFTAIIKLGEPEHVFYITQIVIIWKKSLTPRMTWGWENHGVI